MLSNLLAGRILMGTSLGIHFLLSAIGMGFPLFISLAELIGLRTKDQAWTVLARRWSSAYVILFASGAATGLVVGQELSLLWPGFMKRYGPVIALPFFIEVFAFFIESIFLGIYVFGWDRFKNRWLHWLCSLPIIIASLSTGALITVANAFMNSPAGFRADEHGKIVDIQPLAAIFNAAMPSTVLHTIMSVYTAVAFMLAAFTAWKMLRGRRGRYYTNALKLVMSVALVAILGTLFSGDLSGKYLAQHQPEKFAAIEAQFRTEVGAPVIIGGTIDEQNQRVVGGIAIPKLLSFLASGDPDHVVQGLDAFPKDQRPPISIHYLFLTMVGSGMYMLGMAGLFVFSFLTQKRPAWLSWLNWLRGLVLGKAGMIALLIAGPMGFVAIESGWIMAEVGRQPWIVYHSMRVSDALTTSPYVSLMFYILMPFYVLTLVATVYLLWAFYRRRPLTLPADMLIEEPVLIAPSVTGTLA